MHRAWILAALFWAVGGCSSDVSTEYRIEANYAVGDPQFVRTMGNLLGPPILPGNTVSTLCNGDEIFPALLQGIRAAKKTITLETYIYWSGTIGQEFADALAERARAGVKVHVIIDWLGSSKIDGRYIEELLHAGATVHTYHPIRFYDVASFGRVDNRTHRKLLIIDGKVGFTGGVGIADIWRGNAQDEQHWRDNHYRVEGPIVAQLQATFMDNWMKISGEVLNGEEYFPLLEPTGKAAAQVFKSSSGGGSQSMQLMFLLSIAAAHSHIQMESAYFVPDDVTIKTLLAAKKRGVEIEIIVPGSKIDETVVRRASRSRWGDLLQNGIAIYEYEPTMFHCKQMIVDELWVSVGSSNLDNRSFRLNDEANLNVLSAEFAADQIRIFNRDKTQCTRMTYQNWSRRPLFGKFIESLASLLGHEL